MGFIRAVKERAMFGWFKRKPSPPQGADFSEIDSREKAEALFRRGNLEKLFLMPLEFGGEATR
jgi:hypothetical protein